MLVKEIEHQQHSSVVYQTLLRWQT